MITLWLASGVIAKAASAPPVPAPGVGGSYLPDPRRRRLRDEQEKEERESLRRIIDAAWERLNEPEARELIELVRPALVVSRGPGLPAIDWESLAGRIAAVERAAAEFSRALQDEDDEEDIMAILMAA